MKEIKRHGIQAIAALLTNLNLKGFATGQIWQGRSKSFCVPGLNCYSCPAAVGACPIGALQSVLSGHKKGIPYYVVGMLLFFGVLLGRVICGFLCPFGWIQDLLYKIKVKKRDLPIKLDRKMRYLKYIILLLFVLILPFFVQSAFGIGDPWFCKYICPAGTLEGGIALVIKNESLREMIGWLFSWKMLLLILFIVSSMIIYRPFCKYICPLGAIYGLFNKVSFWKMKVQEDTCTHCNACTKVCKMKVQVPENINSPECIRCGACKNVCPVGAIKSGFMLVTRDANTLNIR